MVQMPLQLLMRIYLHNMALTDICRQGTDCRACTCADTCANRETSYDKSKPFGTEVMTKAGYMRFTLIGNGANAVITLNEEIG